MWCAEGARLEQSVNHDAQALRHKLSGLHGHYRRHSAGIRRAEPQRIRTINVRFADDTDDHDDIGNQRPLSGSYGLLTDLGERRVRLRGMAARGAVERGVPPRWAEFVPRHSGR